jgi:hypothetical protein
MTKAEVVKNSFRVRAIDSTHIFYGDECPALEGTAFRLNPGDQPIEIPASMAEYFHQFPGLRVDTLFPNLATDQEI